MTWQPWLLVSCSIATAFLGWITYKRGRQNDDVLNVAANIQATYDTQTEINTSLRSEVDRLRASHQRCEEVTSELRRSFAGLQLVGDEQAREIARLENGEQHALKHAALNRITVLEGTLRMVADHAAECTCEALSSDLLTLIDKATEKS